MAAYKYIPDLILDHAKVMASTKQGFDVDRYGHKNICLWIDDHELAQQLIEDGWDIHVTRPSDDFPELRHYLPVEFKYDFMNPEYKESMAPKVYMIEEGWKQGRKVELDEVTISKLANMRISYVDATIRPRQSERKTGEPYIKAYVAYMYVTVEGKKDAFADRYAAEEHPEDE